VLEVANQLHRRLGQTQLARRKAAGREADVLDGDRRPFQRAVFTGGGAIAQAPVHPIRAISVWPLPSPRAGRSRLGGGARRSPAARAAGAGRGAAKGPVPP
jgi:hypothetical protein